jgi:hypothetical protein
MKKNQLNKEEEILRDKLNQVEFSFQPDDWTAFQKQLPSSGGNLSWFSGKSIIGAAVVVSLTVAWFMSQDDKSTEAPQNKSKQAIVINSDRENESTNSTTKEKESESRIIEEEQPVESIKQGSNTEDDQLADQNESISTANKKPIDTKDQEPEMADAVEQAKDIEFQEDPKKEVSKPAAHESMEPSITGLYAPDRVCEGGKFSVGLDMDNDLPRGYTIDWYVAGKLLAKDSRISSMRLEDNGLNQFKIIVKDPNGKVYQSYEKTIERAMLPELDFTYEDLKDPYLDFSAVVKVEPALYSSYQWFDKDDKLLAEGANAQINFEKKGYYDLTLKAKSQDGCLNTLKKPLMIEADFDPLAPTGISPLNQDGTNDSFMPESFKNRDDQFNMQILTLDGKLIYETSNVLEEWNGKQNNIGQMMPPGQYVWKASISNAEGRSRTFFGNVRIIP